MQLWQRIGCKLQTRELTKNSGSCFSMQKGVFNLNLVCFGGFWFVFGGCSLLLERTFGSFCSSVVVLLLVFIICVHVICLFVFFFFGGGGCCFGCIWCCVSDLQKGTVFPASLAFFGALLVRRLFFFLPYVYVPVCLLCCLLLSTNWSWNVWCVSVFSFPFLSTRLFGSCWLVLFVFLKFCIFLVFPSHQKQEKKKKNTDTAETPKTTNAEKSNFSCRLAHLCSQILFLIFGVGW